MFNRLTTRLVASHLLVIAIAMTLLGFLLLSLVQSYFEQALQQSLITQARLTAQALVSSGGASNVTQAALPPAQNVVQQSQITAQTQNISPTLDNTTLRLSAELETRVRVTDARGIVQADSANTERGRDLSGDPAIAAALRGQEFAHTQDDLV
ncbi:MAG: hypothetical protein L0Y55_06305, partial [Anaerolineales bacterium]|nr:hypothetical protein [Anaerolineales bacterium]